MNEDKTLYEHLIAMWNIHETLLQSYRRIFITAQSVIFAVAVAVASTSVPWFSLPFMVLGLVLVKHWREICKKRGNDVWYFQLQILKLEDGQTVEPNLLTNLMEWQRRDYAEQVDIIKNTMDRTGKNSLGHNLVTAKTRKIMEVTLPNVFLVLWWFTPLLIVFRILVMYKVITLPV